MLYVHVQLLVSTSCSSVFVCVLVSLLYLCWTTSPLWNIQTAQKTKWELMIILSGKEASIKALKKKKPSSINNLYEMTLLGELFHLEVFKAHTNLYNVHKCLRKSRKLVSIHLHHRALYFWTECSWVKLHSKFPKQSSVAFVIDFGCSFSHFLSQLHQGGIRLSRPFSQIRFNPPHHLHHLL